MDCPLLRKPPPEALLIYEHSPSPCVADYLIPLEA